MSDVKLKANQPLEATVSLSISKLETLGALTVTTSTFMVFWESCSGGTCVAAQVSGIWYERLPSVCFYGVSVLSRCHIVSAYC